jgi:N6-L-threonylcarbamoyladenine synthase
VTTLTRDSEDTGTLLVLGIESSCDETAAALVENGKTVLASRIASQVDVHAKFGGVVPEIASREHLRHIHPLVETVLGDCGKSVADIDAIAVTQGPGLIGALLVGIAYAKGLASATGKPLIPVDHVHAHIHGAILDPQVQDRSIFPCLGLVVSGGHTNLYLMGSSTHFKLLGSSIDDACGESFDKVAKLMGLGYPGGPAIEKLAALGNSSKVTLPRMVEQKSRIEFSYSGLKTFMANLLNSESKPIAHERLADICAAFQQEALGQLVRKIKAASERHPEARSILIAGGVAANQHMRRLMAASLPQLKAYFPAPAYCSDNAAMIAAYGYHIYQTEQKEDPSSRRFLTSDWDAYSRYDYAKVLHHT